MNSIKVRHSGGIREILGIWRQTFEVTSWFMTQLFQLLGAVHMEMWATSLPALRNLCSVLIYFVSVTLGEDSRTWQSWFTSFSGFFLFMGSEMWWCTLWTVGCFFIRSLCFSVLNHLFLISSIQSPHCDALLAVPGLRTNLWIRLFLHKNPLFCVSFSVDFGSSKLGACLSHQGAVELSWKLWTVTVRIAWFILAVFRSDTKRTSWTLCRHCRCCHVGKKRKKVGRSWILRVHLTSAICRSFQNLPFPTTCFLLVLSMPRVFSVKPTLVQGKGR